MLGMKVFNANKDSDTEQGYQMTATVSTTIGTTPRAAWTTARRTKHALGTVGTPHSRYWEPVHARGYDPARLQRLHPKCEAVPGVGSTMTALTTSMCPDV
jgi:hypothetical protein